MSGSEPAPADDLPVARGPRNRQRQRLIDACISALHIHGPSRTTVEKVVAIANLSPGIVRFYFKSKAAMLVASLQYLASEFDDKVLEPVTAIRETPVEAMRLLVDLYLDPEVASPRKISVWYAFWGEASSRQEYYEICGHKDDSFVVLVRDLMGRLVAASGEPHLDVEALSLGFIGLLEVLWQGFAFQFEADIDRPAARERCLAYLRSVFPAQFAGALGPARVAAPMPPGASGPLLQRGREWLARTGQPVAHASDVAVPGSVVAVRGLTEPVMLVRDPSGSLRAFANRCPRSPHELASSTEAIVLGELRCAVHGLHWRLDGTPVAEGEPSLAALPLKVVRGLLVLNADDAGDRLVGALDVAGDGPLEPTGAAREWKVAAEWHVVATHWLDTWFGGRPAARLGFPAARTELRNVDGGADVEWHLTVPDKGNGMTADRLATLVGARGDAQWTRRFVAPNVIIDRYPGGLAVLTVRPQREGGSQVSFRGYRVHEEDAAGRALARLAERLLRRVIREDSEILESLQRAYSASTAWLPQATATSPVGRFRRLLGAGR